MSTLRRLIVWCLIIYVFPIYVRAFFVTPPTSCLPRHQALHLFRPSHPLDGTYQVFFFGGPWAHLYACSVAKRTYCDRGDTWVLKNARLRGTRRTDPPFPRPAHSHSPSIGTSQRSITTSTPSPVSQKLYYAQVVLVPFCLG